MRSLTFRSSILFVLLAGCGSNGAASGGGDDSGTHQDAKSRADAGKSTDSGTGSHHDGGSRGGGDSAPTVDTGAPPSSVGASVLQFHNHVNRDGLFIDKAITEAAAATFGRDSSFAGAVTGNVYASPLYVEKGPAGKGTFYVATESGTVFALDETTGATVWQTNVGTAPSQTGSGCGNISPIGITGTPAIDLTTRLIVFNSAIANASNTIATHTIFALSIDTGKIVWQVDASTLSDSTGLTFAPVAQNQRGAILIVGGTAYVTYGGQDGDCGDYHGWVVGVPLSGTGAKAWATSVSGAGIWAVGGPASDGENVFVTTGNGKMDGMSWADSEAIFRLSPGPVFSGATEDFYALYNWSQLDGDDLDLSGSGPLIIDAPALTPSALVLGQGKDGTLYLVDRTNMGGIATSATPANVGSLKVQTGQITNGGAWATVGGVTYVVVRPNGQQTGVGCPSGTSGDLVAVKLDPTASQKMSVAWCAKSGGVGSPSITSSDGNGDPLVWAFAADPGNSGMLMAWDLTTGKPVFAGGAAADQAQNVRRFTTPIAVHGRLFVGGDNQLYAFKAK